MSIENLSKILDQLEDILNRQTDLLNKGNFAEMELLAMQADSLVKQLSNANILDSPEFLQRRDNLKNLYQAFGLALASEKAQIGMEINKIHQNKKTINAYRKAEI